MVLRRAPAYGRRGRAARRAPLRGAGVRRARAGRPARRPRDSGGSGRWPAAGDAARVRGARGGAPCRRHRPGVRVGGDLDRAVRTVAVCGGAGDDLFDAVRAAGADVYVTADLRHHPASEALEHGGAGAWSTSATGPASGRGWPTARAARCAAGLGDARRIRWRRGSPGSSPTRGSRRSPGHHRHDREEPALKAAACRPAAPARRPGPRHPASTSSRTAARTLPEHAALAELETELAALRDQIVGAETEQSDLAPRADARPRATSTRSGPAPSATRSGSTPGRSPRPRSWRACSTRSRRWPAARATSRRSCSSHGAAGVVAEPRRPS